MTAPLILALDISKVRTGIAEGRAGDEPRAYSIGDARDTTIQAMVRLGRFIIDRTKRDTFDAIYFEESINPGAFLGEYDVARGKIRMTSNPSTTISLSKMIGIVEFLAAMRSIPAHPIKVQTIRVAFLGSGFPPCPKERALAMCRVLGWKADNKDQSDALAVWYVGATREAPKLARIVTPMEQKKAAAMTSAIDEQARVKKAARKERKQEHSATGPFSGAAQEHISAAEANFLLAGRRR